MSYADVSLAASSSQSVSTPIVAGTTFNFGNANRGDLTSLENNPILPSTATSTKATGGNAVSDTAVPITTAAGLPAFDWKPVGIGAAMLAILFIAYKKFL